MHSSLTGGVIEFYTLFRDTSLASKANRAITPTRLLIFGKFEYIAVILGDFGVSLLGFLPYPFFLIRASNALFPNNFIGNGLKNYYPFIFST